MTEHQRSNVTNAAEGLPRRRFSVVEVEAMNVAGIISDDERVELIGGELVPMSPKGIRHEGTKTAILDRWYRVKPNASMVIPATTFRLSEDTYLEPDVVVCDRASGVSGLSGESVLLVVEIADSSLRYDIGRKAKLYASFGIRELWVIDAVTMKIRIFQSPSKDGYRNALDLSASEGAVPAIAPIEFALKLADLDIE